MSLEMLDQKRIIRLFILYGVGIFVLTTTKPDGWPLVALLIPFFYLFVVLYLSFELLIRRGFHLSERLSKTVAFIISIFITLLMVMRSITQLTIRDILLSVSIATILTWYIVKLSRQA